MVNGSYKLSLIFAITLHLVLIIFLLIKFTNSKPVGLVATNNFINATAINERDFDDQMNKALVSPKTTVKPEKPPQIIPKPKPIAKIEAQVQKPIIKKDQLKTVLQKKLLAEHAKEIAELKKEQQKYKENAAKLEQQQKLQKMLQEQVATEQKQLADSEEAQHGHQLQGEIDKYKALIIQSISSNWIVPDGVAPGDFCQLLVNVAPGGVVLNVQLIKSSGNSVLDRSAEAAVLKASPLPVPEEIKLFDHVRIIKPTFRPEGIIGN